MPKREKCIFLYHFIGVEIDNKAKVVFIQKIELFLVNETCKINLSKFNKLSMNSAQNDFESFAGLVKHDLEFFGLNRARYT